MFGLAIFSILALQTFVLEPRSKPNLINSVLVKRRSGLIVRCLDNSTRSRLGVAVVFATSLPWGRGRLNNSAKTMAEDSPEDPWELFLFEVQSASERPLHFQWHPFRQVSFP